MKKNILFTHQGVNGGNISPHKPTGFVSLDLDGIKVTIDAYKGQGKMYEPRDKCLITVADEKMVFEFDTEVLMEIIRFYTDYAASPGKIVSFRNRYHYIASTPAKTG
jgi:hypothetical protein